MLSLLIVVILSLGFKLGLVQMSVGSNLAENLHRASQLVGQAALSGARLVALPECFNSPYSTGVYR